ncbi:uncharacterized protein LOC108812760 isoform X3 [Raphanus sativus]|nr:uncharacterized protein LOC108812760 isoform X3 [Raphanus sativus]
MKKGELEADTDKLMREYRAQLDAERAMKLSKGRNFSSDKSRKDRKERDVTDKKDRDSKRKKSKKRKVLPRNNHIDVREGIRLTQAPPPQAHPPSHQAAMKRNLEGQGQVLEDLKGRRNTNLKVADTRAKAKMWMMVQCLCRNSLAVLRRVRHPFEDLCFIIYSICYTGFNNCIIFRHENYF